MDKDFEISRSFFGGYNVKKASEYIDYLRKELEEAQTSLAQQKEETDALQAKLAEAEACYRGLWEKSKMQEELAEQHKKSMGQSSENIQKLQETNSRQLDTIRKLQELTSQQQETINQQQKLLNKHSSVIPSGSSTLQNVTKKVDELWKRYTDILQKR